MTEAPNTGEIRRQFVNGEIRPRLRRYNDGFDTRYYVELAGHRAGWVLRTDNGLWAGWRRQRTSVQGIPCAIDCRLRADAVDEVCWSWLHGWT